MNLTVAKVFKKIRLREFSIDEKEKLYDQGEIYERDWNTQLNEIETKEYQSEEEVVKKERKTSTSVGREEMVFLFFIGVVIVSIGAPALRYGIAEMFGFLTGK